MDTHVLHILLLLALTVVCVGVSLGLKYDKSGTDSHPNMPFSHTIEDEQLDNYEQLTQELKNKISILSSEFVFENQSAQTIDDNTSSIKPTVDTGGNLSLAKTTKTTTLDDLNKMFLSESINDTTARITYLNAFGTLTTTNNTNTGAHFKISNLIEGTSYGFTIQGSDSGQYYNIGYNKNNNNEFTIFRDKTSLINNSGDFSPPDSNTLYAFDNSGFWMYKGKYIALSETNSNFLNFIDSPISNAYGRTLFKVGGGTTNNNYPFYIFTVKLLSSPLTSQLYNLEYYGVTTNSALPPPVKQNYLLDEFDPLTLSIMYQIPKFVSNALGIFATISTANTNNVPDDTDPNDFIGLNANIAQTRYAISFLKYTYPVPENYQLNIYSTIPKYDIPTNGDIFYSINVISFEQDELGNTITLVDKNNVKGVQNIVILTGKKQADQTPDSYSIRQRGNRDFIANPSDVFEVAFVNQQLYNIYARYNILGIVVFPLYHEQYTSQSIEINGFLELTNNNTTVFVNPSKDSYVKQYSYVWDPINNLYIENVLDSDGNWTPTTN